MRRPPSSRRLACRILKNELNAVRVQHGTACPCIQETEVCVNERGGYRCVPASSSVAPNPFTTTTARSSPRIPCPRGYIFSDDSRRCIGDRKQSIDFKTYALYYFYKWLIADVKECIGVVSLCKGNKQCENTVGSYVCRCAVGYRFNIARSAKVSQSASSAMAFHLFTWLTRHSQHLFPHDERTGYTFNSQKCSCEGKAIEEGTLEAQ